MKYSKLVFIMGATVATLAISFFSMPGMLAANSTKKELVDGVSKRGGLQAITFISKQEVVPLNKADYDSLKILSKGKYMVVNKYEAEGFVNKIVKSLKISSQDSQSESYKKALKILKKYQ